MPFTYYIKENNQAIQLAEQPFASGGEGALHQVLQPSTWEHCVAKIIYPHKRTAEKEAKLQYQLAHPPPLDYKQEHLPIMWVQALLYDQQGDFVGFLLPKATGEKLEILTAPKLPKYLGTEWQRLRLGHPQALALRLKVCYNIALAVHLLHATQKYVLVDLKPDNVLLQSNGRVSIVDTDSVEIVEGNQTLFPATVATPEYTPQEYYQGVKPGQVKVDPSWDNFGLAIIFYRLLFGIHPFAGTAKPPYEELTSLGDKIKMGLFVHHPEYASIFKVIPPPHQVFYQQEKELQALFQQAFVQGHEQAAHRPTALTWVKIFANHPLLLTNRTLPSNHLSLEALKEKNWYRLAVEELRKKHFPSQKVALKKAVWSIARRPFREQLQENFRAFWNFSKQLVVTLVIAYSIVFTLLIMVTLLGGNSSNWYFLSEYLEFTWKLLKWGGASPLLVLYLFFPLLQTVFSEAKNLFSAAAIETWKGKGSAVLTTLGKSIKELKEQQYILYTKRSQLKTKIRELKNEYHVYKRVKDQKEMDFGKTYQAGIVVVNKKMQRQLQAQKASLYTKDQQAYHLIQEEAQAIRSLRQQQQQELEENVIFNTIRGKTSQQKLQFLKTDPISWQEPLMTQEMVYNALERVHQVHHTAQTALKKQYDKAHEQLLEEIEQEKEKVQALMGQSLQDLQEKIKLEDLLFDKAFLKTLQRMEELKTTIEAEEKTLQLVQEQLQRVKEGLK